MTFALIYAALVVGFCLGFLIASLLAAAGRADKENQ